jgi:shikimate dehydrogenase
MKHYALIGSSLDHSYSKSWFDRQHFADADYQLCPMPSVDDVRQWVVDPNIDGFNITTPYKQAILPYLDSLAPEAAETGAVNCVVVDRSPDSTIRLTGHNTDGPAFRQTLDNLLTISHIKPHTAFILGTGGAAQAVAWALRRLGLTFHFVSRHPELHPDSVGYDELPSLITHHTPLIIINATPVGTWPDVDRTPVDLTALHTPLTDLCLYDLVYNPTPTLLMQQAQQRGAHVKDGLEMLHLQALISWQHWGLI